MTQTASTERIDQRLLLLAPEGCGAQVTAATLREAGLRCDVCEDGDELLRGIGEGAGAVVIAEESLTGKLVQHLGNRLLGQPVWSDLPLILLLGEGRRPEEEPGGRAHGLEGHITILERPVREMSLVSAARTALRARQRQYELRDYLSERATREAALRRSEARFRVLAEANMIGLLTADHSGRIRTANSYFLQLVGYSRQDLTAGAVRWERLTPPEWGEADRRAAKLQRARGACHPYEKELLRKDGTRVPVLMGVATLEEGGDDTICFVLDLTAQKKAQRQLESLNNTLEQRVRQRAAFLHLMEEVTRAANEAENLDEAMRYTLRRICRHGVWTVGHVYRPVSDDGVGGFVPTRLWYRQRPGYERLEEAAMATRVPEGHGLIGRVGAAAVPKHTNEVRADPRFRGCDGELGVAAAVAFPVLVGREVVAVMEFFADEPVEVSQTLLDVMAHIGVQLGRVAERQHFQQHMIDALWEEQRRIAQDLHDNLAQKLTGVAMLAQSLAERHERGEPPRSDTLQTLCEVARDTQEEIRQIARGLYPVEIDAGGLPSALEKLTDNIRALYGIDCCVHSDDTAEVSDSRTATHLYLIAQEAMANAARHAGANRITVTLRSDHQRLDLKIEDDGKGIDPSPEGDGGMGQRTMRYRANAIGAELRIGHAANRGTVVSCTLERKPSHEPSEPTRR